MPTDIIIDKAIRPPIIHEGFVYFIYMPDTYPKDNLIKIGFTKNLEKRLQSLQTGNPHNLAIYKTIKHIKYKEYEKDLHEKYKAVRVRGEWFRMTLSQVDEIILSYEIQHEIDRSRDNVPYRYHFSAVDVIYESMQKSTRDTAIPSSSWKKTITSYLPSFVKRLFKVPESNPIHA